MLHKATKLASTCDLVALVSAVGVTEHHPELSRTQYFGLLTVTVRSCRGVDEVCIGQQRMVWQAKNVGMDAGEFFQ